MRFTIEFVHSKVGPLAIVRTHSARALIEPIVVVGGKKVSTLTQINAGNAY